MSRALVYARVSTSDKGQKPEVQLTELRRFCAARGWDILEEITDHGFSGGTDKRPGLARLMSLARGRKVDVVVVAKMDRLFRSLRHLVTTLDEFQTLGVQFASIGDQIDLTTASGRLMLQIVGAFSEFERALVRERTLAGLAYARKQGKRLGRPKTRDDEAILALRRQGLSYSEIERRLGVSRPSIRRALIENSTGTKTPEKRPQKSQSFQGGKDE